MCRSHPIMAPSVRSATFLFGQYHELCNAGQKIFKLKGIQGSRDLLEVMQRLSFRVTKNDLAFR